MQNDYQDIVSADNSVFPFETVYLAEISLSARTSLKPNTKIS